MQPTIIERRRRHQYLLHEQRTGPSEWPALVALWSNTPTNARGARQPEGLEFKLPVTPEKNVMLLSVHALRLISRAGKRVQRCPL